jgi:hypothetical protein
MRDEIMFPGPAGRLYRETLALQLVIQMYALYPALSGEWEVPVTRNAKITGGWGAPPLRDHLWQGPPLPVTLRLTQRLMTPHPPALGEIGTRHRCAADMMARSPRRRRRGGRCEPVPRASTHIILEPLKPGDELHVVARHSSGRKKVQAERLTRGLRA